MAVMIAELPDLLPESLDDTNNSYDMIDHAVDSHSVDNDELQSRTKILKAASLIDAFINNVSVDVAHFDLI